MKAPKIKGMSFEALIDLRKQIDRQISRQRDVLEGQLARLGVVHGKKRGRPAGRKSKLTGRKVPPKYRNPNNRSETWAGRGAMPRWLAAMVKEGKKVEQFLIAKKK
jgi:DNA-binding protein H-NS